MGEIKHLQETLTPIVLGDSTPGYRTVQDIEEKLNDPEVFNIAVTGPYGSGKSTVLKSLRSKAGDKHKFLTISLASLTGERENGTIEGSEQQEIEFSILQQLIYKEKPDTLPNSSFHRISQRSKCNAFWFGLAVIAFIASFFVVFEPQWLRVESICQLLDFGEKWNLRFDIVCTLYMLFCIYKFAAYAFRHYRLFHVKSLNLKNVEIELTPNSSVFNKHLAEIVYFFESTDYDVVIIEDLDRFRCPEIFQKLREINYLLRESEVLKEQDRKIKFIYAIKDDLFHDRERTKFFDYIATVIPVVNPKNSCEKLTQALSDRGYTLKRDTLLDLSEFVDDMRMLKNVVNEFQQYMERLAVSSTPNKTKLLAMIIYKNHHPDDFGKLHYKDGAVYSVLNKKANWITIATDKVINPRIEVWEKKKETMLNSQKFNMNQWRVLYMEKYREHLDPSLSSISVQGNFYPISSIVNDPNLFEILIQQDRISYKCKQYYNGQFVETTANISFKDIQNEVDDKIGYLERKKLVEGSITEIDQEIRLVREEENRLRSYKLSDLLTQFPEIKETEEFKNIGLSQLMIHFLQQGYIDETYYDFITVFDGTTMSLNDRDLLSRVKQNSALVAYDEKIDDVESFVQEMPRFAFGYKSALNFQVADYLEDHSVSYRQALDLFEKQFTISAVPPLDFLALYYRKGYLGSEKLWKSFIKNSTSWLRIQSYEKKEYWDTLVEAWLKYCGPNNVSGVVREWLNSNLGFCTERVDAIGTQHLKDIIQGCVFNDIYSLGPIGGQLQDDKVMDIANFILDNKMFKLTDGNIFIACEITGNPFKESLSVETLTISDILSSGNKGFVEYVFENIKSVFESYISKSLGQEQEQGLVWICNNEELEEEQKKNYLRKQALNKITDITEVENHYIAMAIRGKVLYPSWSNVLNYFKIDQEILSDDLMGFIDDNADVLKAASYPENIDSVFAGEMVYCSYLKIDTYKKLLPVLIKKVRQEDESMLDVDTGEERVRLLVENNYLSDKYETASVVLNFGAKLYAQYLSCHISSFISNYENYEIDAETLAMLLDKASSITNGQRWSLAKKVTSDHVKQNGSLADALIALMWYRKEELEWDVVEVVLRKATDTTSKMQFQKWIIKRHSEETDKIIVVIGLMPLPYREIIDENKRPLIPKDFKEYLDIIHRLGIIASYREESKGYRVYHSPK